MATSIQQFMDLYAGPPIQIDSATYALVSGFFETRGFDSDTSKAIAYTIIRQCNIDGINPQDVIASLKNSDGIKLNGIVTEIINYSRFKTSFLGFTPETDIPYLVSRTILV